MNISDGSGSDIQFFPQELSDLRTVVSLPAYGFLTVQETPTWKIQLVL